MISNTDDTIDSCEVIERIEELRAEWAEATGDDPDDYSLSGDDWLAGLTEDDRDELVSLMELAEEGKTWGSEWTHGVTLVADDHFEDYARQLAEDIGAIDRDASWPLGHIDWEAAAVALLVDYTSIEFDGATYWGRA